MWDKVQDGVRISESHSKPKITGYGNITRDQLAAHDWYEHLRLDPDPPEGQQVGGYKWIGVENNRSVYEPTYAPIPEPVEPTPARFDAGIDTGLLVLDAPDGKGIGYVADETGTLVPIVYAHESPYDMAALRTRIAQARIDNAAARTARQAEAREAGKAAGEARSMNELRAEVARLAAIVEGIA